MIQTIELGRSETYGQEVCTLARALLATLLGVSGVRWAPGSGVIATCRVFDLDDFGSSCCQQPVWYIEYLRYHAESSHTLNLQESECNMAVKYQRWVQVL